MNTVVEAIRKIEKLKIETTRRCPLSTIHTKCPVAILNKEFNDSLDVEVLFGFLKQMKDYECKAQILLYMYNEPSADCKLSYIIHYIRDHLNIKNHVMFDSNGWGLDEQTIRMLFDIGLDRIVITGYTDEEYNKFRLIKEKLFNDSSFDRKTKILNVRAVNDEHTQSKMSMVETYSSFKLDERLDYYKDGNEGKLQDVDISQFSCVKLDTLLCVSATGEVTMCEYDWKQTVSFGNLYKDSLEDIITNKIKFNERAYKQAILPDVCTHCVHYAGMRRIQ